VDELTCQRCGAPLPEDARFCPRCGAPVVISAVQERKVVTVLFADLARSTELAASLDAERFRDVMGEFYRMVSTELSSLRGRAEKFIGDAVLAVFGHPHAHDDDALRAVRAGLIIRDRTVRLGETLDLPMPLQVRVGVNSGPVALGSELTDQFLVSGAPVNLAARLQEAADPGEILVGETTHQLTRYSVGFGEVRLVQAKGFGEVRAWPVASLSPRSSRRTIPLAGRRRELTLLEDAFQRAREGSRPHLVTVLGEPGIGKTRLVEEFVSGLPEDTKVLTGRASEYEEDATFAPLAEMIRGELGVGRDEPAEQLKRRLDEVVQGCCQPSEAEQVSARLGLALGFSGEGRESRRYRAAEIRSGFLAFVAGMSKGNPVVLVFDDLHVATPALLDLISETVRQSRGLPLLVLCVARDTLLEQRPDWGGGIPDAVTLRLEPLRLEEATDLAVAAGESLDQETAEQIALAAGGNPFFIIETTGMLLQEHIEHVTGVLHSHVLPPTVQAVVASRIDHLPEPARDLARKASVFARATFQLSDLALIAEPHPELLQTLEDAELLVRDPQREDVWRFRHDMLRDVAYESLPKRERQRLHLLVAEGLEREAPGRYPQAVAYHLQQAARAGLDLDPKDRTLADRAVEALAHAGDLSRWRMESSTAADLYARALALAGPEEGWGVRESRILAALGETGYWRGEFDEAAAALSRALEIGGEDPWTRALACRFLGDIELNVRGQPDRAEVLFDQALAAARELTHPDQPWVLARVLLMAGWAPYWRNDLPAARATFEEALAVARANPEKDLWAQARALTSLTSVISPVGNEEECLDLAKQALALGREMADPFTIGVAQQNVGNSLRRMWRLDEAAPAFDDSVGRFREIGARWELASALGDRATVQRYAGRLAAAQKDAREALELCRQLRERSLISWTASELALILLARGDTSGAREVLEEPYAALTTTEPGSASSPRIAGSLLALAEGDRDRALKLALEALEIARKDGHPNPIAARVWWMGRLFGPEDVGGEDVMEDARRTLERAHWISSLHEPDPTLATLSPSAEADPRRS